jgi:TonB family protein
MRHARTATMQGSIAVCLVLFSGAVAWADCASPKYRIGAITLDDQTMLLENISIPVQEFTPSKLVCLATRLKERYKDRKSILIYIFDSHQASRYSIMVGELNEEIAQMYAQIHALYVLNADLGAEYIKILPAGLPPSTGSREGPYSTQIDLPAATTPHCYLEINGRCLMALEDPRYPPDAARRRVSGAITLTGTITRSGEISGIRVTKKASTPQGEENDMATAAVHNLSTWRLETGTRAEAVQITYSFAIDSSLPGGVSTQVDWALPREVVVKGNPKN